MNMRLLQKLILTLSLYLFFTVATHAQGRISGQVVNRNTQEPLRGIFLTLTPGSRVATSDSAGNFRLTDLKPEAYTLTVSGVGFLSRAYPNLVITSGNEIVLEIELDPVVKELQGVSIGTKKNTAKAATLESPLSIQRLTTEEIRANPGGNFDISRVIQSLPGVGGGAAGGSFRNDIIIRGGSPAENVFYLDGIEVPIINHFSTQGSGGGPQGILNVSFIEEVKLSTSAFDAKYDNALSSVFQFKQKNGNAEKLQGNFRLSATDAAITLDGPLSKKTTFLASARRSYLQFLFEAIDLPIRPNYWDFQFKSTTRINEKTTLSILGIGSIDEFSFGVPREATPEKLYVLNSNPIIQQNSYTVGATLKRLIPGGYWNLSLSRNRLNNQTDKYEDNQNPDENERTAQIRSIETENKLRWEVIRNRNGIKFSYGAVAQYVQFDNTFYQLLRPRIVDGNGNELQAEESLQALTDLGFWRYGAFGQVGGRLFDGRLAWSGGVRIDANNLSNSESNPFRQLSPRASLSYALTDKWNLSASYGLYYRLPSYTLLAYQNPLSSNSALTNPGDYIRSNHWAAGVEFLPDLFTRFTIEGFYKGYSNYPISITDEISLANKGTEFGAIGNEPVVATGQGRAYGVEVLYQQKLTKRIFGVFSGTFYRSEFTGLNGIYVPASWDNKVLISATGGYKLNRNWEIGAKFRYQGAAPYTPYDPVASRYSYQLLGMGVFNFAQLNTLRLPAFHAADLRIDKKWNYRKVTLDVFLDITNVYASKAAGIPQFTFQRTPDNTAFATTDGAPLKADGSNAIPVLLDNRDGRALPTIGLIVEF
jgi:hypothetical protein